LPYNKERKMTELEIKAAKATALVIAKITALVIAIPLCFLVFGIGGTITGAMIALALYMIKMMYDAKLDELKRDEEYKEY